MKKTSTFFDTFNGELMLFILQDKQSQPIQTPEGEVIMIDAAITAQGYLLEEDSLYYYLGDDGKEVSKSIKKSRVVYADITTNEEEAPIEKRNPSEFN